MENKIIEQFDKLWKAIDKYAETLEAEEWELMENAFDELKAMVTRPENFKV